MKTVFLLFLSFPAKLCGKNGEYLASSKPLLRDDCAAHDQYKLVQISTVHFDLCVFISFELDCNFVGNFGRFDADWLEFV